MKTRIKPLMLGVICISLSTLPPAKAGPLETYYSVKTTTIQQNFKDLAVREEIDTPNGKLALFLIPGDIFDFIGPKTGQRRARWHVDRMIASTNSGLRFETMNPTIQSRLRKTLPAAVVKKIEGTFKQTRVNYVDILSSVLVRTSSNFSPREFSFVITDLPEGRTWDNPKWVDEELKRERIAARVLNALNVGQSSKPRFIVTPLIGASKVALGSTSLTKVEDRLEFKRRMEKSLRGIMEGLKDHLTLYQQSSIKEFAIIVWPEDIKRLIPKDELKSGQFRDPKPGSYMDFKEQLVEAFSNEAQKIRFSIKYKRGKTS